MRKEVDDAITAHAFNPQRGQRVAFFGKWFVETVQGVLMTQIIVSQLLEFFLLIIGQGLWKIFKVVD